MRIAVFDTETTSLEKPFCYNIGLFGYDTETKETLFKKEWVIEQIWHNLELFSTAYYADKRKIYIGRLRSRLIHLDKFGYVMQKINRLLINYEIDSVYAYNSPFDEKVINFNCDWFKCINPLENMPIFDIRAFVHNSIAFTTDFQEWAEEKQEFTDAGNYSTTAETIYRYISKSDFTEEHTALSDSEIEMEILLYCCEHGSILHSDYTVYKSIPRIVHKTLTLTYKPTNKVYEFDYTKIFINKSKTIIDLK